MAAKDTSGYSLKLAGPGVTFDRPISEDIANRIINLVMTGSLAAAPLPPGAPGSAQLGNPAHNQGQPAPAANIKQFIAQKRPANMYQRVACLGYYLTHAGTPHFKTKDISQANTDAAQSKMTNAASFVGDATKKYGYLSEAGKGNKQLSAFGEEIVAALPDQEKVKQLHAENKPRRSARKNKKKPR